MTVDRSQMTRVRWEMAHSHPQGHDGDLTTFSTKNCCSFLLVTAVCIHSFSTRVPYIHHKYGEELPEDKRPYRSQLEFTTTRLAEQSKDDIRNCILK